MRQLQADSDGSPSPACCWISRTLRLLLTGWMVLFVVSCGSSRKPIVTAQTPPPPVQPAEEILTEVKNEVQKASSGTVTITDFRDGVVHLEGYIASEEQRQALQQTVTKIAGVSEVKEQLTIIPSPFLQALDLLQPFQSQGEVAESSIKIYPHKGCNQAYYEDERLTVDVTMPKPLQYIYADYYVADTEVVAHLLPNPWQSDNLVQQATLLHLGGEASPTKWKIQSPFGLELLTVIASSHPLFDRKRLAPEGVTTYLTKLRQSLPQGRANSPEITTAYCFITSKAAQEEKEKQGEAAAAAPNIAAAGEAKKVQRDTVVSPPPRPTTTAQSSSEGNEQRPTPAVDFLDVSSFDTKLSSALKNASPTVTVQFSAPITVNSIPERLDRWFATVEQHDGAVTLLEDPNHPGPSSRFVGSLALSLAIGVYELIKNKLLYSPAKQYNATVYYLKDKGTVTKVVFTRK